MHTDESLAEALYFSLTDAWPDPDDVPDLADSEVVLAVEATWTAEVRSLVADQAELASLVLGRER